MFFFFKQKTAYEMRISDWSSDVCSSDLNLAGDGDVVKLFTGSWVKEGGLAKPMPVDIATAAVEEAHRHGALVFTHPSDVRGLEVALAAGVDVLAHSVEALDGFEPSHLKARKSGV